MLHTDCDSIFNGRCYKAYQEGVGWHQARDICYNNSGSLVEVCDAQTNEMLLALVEQTGMSTA